MDRYSLGISFSRHKASAVVFNIDTSKVTQSIFVPYLNILDGLGLLIAIDQLFQELVIRKVPLNQVGMIKVSGPEDLAVCTNSIFYKKLMKLSAYATSIKDHFADCFPSVSVLAPFAQNASFVKSHQSEFRTPENALLFTLKSYVNYQFEFWEQTSNIHFVSSFVTSIIAGKRAPVDSSCSKISGMQGSEYQWNDELIRDVSPDLKNKLDQIKDSYENFSYISSYFVEKYGVYREARVLSAGGNSAACARGAGGSVYLDTDDSLHLGAVVNKTPSGNGNFYLNGIVPGQSLCIVASVYDLLLSQIPGVQVELDSMKELYAAKSIVIKNNTPASNYALKLSTLIFNQLAEIKTNSKSFEKIFVIGEYSDNPFFLQACADLFSAEIIAFENSTYGAAIGNALSAARKIQETEYEEVFNAYFKFSNSKVYLPTDEGTSQMLSQLISFSKK